MNKSIQWKIERGHSRGRVDPMNGYHCSSIDLGFLTKIKDISMLKLLFHLLELTEIGCFILFYIASVLAKVLRYIYYLPKKGFH